MMSITINQTVHVLVQNKDATTYYCDSCSLRERCMLARFPCHLFGKGVNWHFEIQSNGQQTRYACHKETNAVAYINWSSDNLLVSTSDCYCNIFDQIRIFSYNNKIQFNVKVGVVCDKSLLPNSSIAQLVSSSRLLSEWSLVRAQVGELTLINQINKKIMTQIESILQNAPKGLTLYSKDCGEVQFSEVSPCKPEIYCLKGQELITYNDHGQRCEGGEVLLLPVKDGNWDQWNVLVKEGDYVEVCDEGICQVLQTDSVWKYKNFRGSVIEVERNKHWKQPYRWASQEEIAVYCQAKLLQPFDKVLVKDCRKSDAWEATLLARFSDKGRYIDIAGHYWDLCIPYNNVTKHLVGTNLTFTES